MAVIVDYMDSNWVLQKIQLVFHVVDNLFFSYFESNKGQ